MSKCTKIITTLNFVFRKCIKCGKQKKVEDFRDSMSRGRIKRSNVCKECEYSKNAAWRNSKPDIKEYLLKANKKSWENRKSNLTDGYIKLLLHEKNANKGLIQSKRSEVLNKMKQRAINKILAIIKRIDHAK